MKMNSLTFYRIASYILIILAAFLGFMALFALLIALSNPALLISVFIIVAVVIYSFTSFLFLIKGIDGKRNQNPKLKDWIKVNAYVAVFFVAMSLLQSISVIINPAIMNEAMKQAASLQQTASPLSHIQMMQIMKVVIWILFVYAVILGSHIVITLRLLKQYAHLFGEKETEL